MVGLLAVALVLLVAAWVRLQVGDELLRDASVGGVPVVPRAQLRQRLEQHALAWGQAAFIVRAGPYRARSTRAGLGASLDVEAAHARASRLGRSGHPLADL